MCMVIVTSTGGCVISIVTTGLHGARLSWLCVRFYRWRRQCIILHSDILILHVQRSDYKERISWPCSLFFNEMYVMTSGKLDYIWRRPMLAKRRFPAWFLKQENIGLNAVLIWKIFCPQAGIHPIIDKREGDYWRDERYERKAAQNRSRQDFLCNQIVGMHVRRHCFSCMDLPQITACLRNK